MCSTGNTEEKHQVKYNEIVCIGLGLSGICLGAKLRRKCGSTIDMHFYDRNESHSGTWWVNHYPGAACDVPITLYSFSFAQTKSWSRLLPGYTEMRDYVSEIVSYHNLEPHMTFQTECEAGIWNDERSIWSLHMRNVVTGEKFIHECRILFSAVGLLSQPHMPYILGAETFQGESFHTARWKDDVSLEGKDIVVIGNGCTGSQLIPAIITSARSVTQIIRTPQWLIPFQYELPPVITRAIRSIPFLGKLFRLIFFGVIEYTWLMFSMNWLGQKIRASAEKTARDHIYKNTPKKYHNILIPTYPIACKRRIYDVDNVYAKALYSENMLLTKDTIIKLRPNGVLTKERFYPADIIVYATGFQTNKSLGQFRIKGKNGMWLEEHWHKLGGPSAYNGISVAGYPNFFMLYGPNTNVGHTSVVIGIENAVNGALKLIAPLMERRAIKVEVREEAYLKWTDAVQAATKKLVFAKERCNNWYISDTGWNGTTYPWSQIHFWWRQKFPVWKDWEYTYIHPKHNGDFSSKCQVLIPLALLGIVSTKYFFS